jgi:hypothetical protein
MKSDIHQLALGCLELVTRKIERETQTAEIWEDLKPHIEEMVKDVFPKKFVEVHPSLAIGFKLWCKWHDKKLKELGTNANDGLH